MQAQESSRYLKVGNKVNTKAAGVQGVCKRKKMKTIISNICELLSTAKTMLLQISELEDSSSNDDDHNSINNDIDDIDQLSDSQSTRLLTKTPSESSHL